MAFAMVFPGQGSQSVGMLQEMAATNELVEDTFGEAGEVLQMNLWKLVSEGPDTELNRTEITQPAILTASVALWRIWCTQTALRPAVMAGHSLGEYSALVCAGVLDFNDAVALVARRGALMQQAVPEGSGGMAAVLGLDDDAVIEVCAQSSGNGIVEAVNFNSPGQVVIAGDRAAVERACIAARDAGARRAQILSVSVPAHSSLMRPAAHEFAQLLNTVQLNDADVEVLHNVGIDQVTDRREALTRQLYNPVPWTKIIRALASRGVNPLLESGPGKVLTGLTRRIDKTLTGQALETPEAMQRALSTLTAKPGE